MPYSKIAREINNSERRFPGRGIVLSETINGPGRVTHTYELNEPHTLRAIEIMDRGRVCLETVRVGVQVVYGDYFYLATPQEGIKSLVISIESWVFQSEFIQYPYNVEIVMYLDENKP